MESRGNPPTDPARPGPEGEAQGAHATGSQPLDPEGQRAWLAQVERKLNLRSYIGAAAAVLALAAGIVAIVLAIDARENSASTDDLRRIERELTGVAEDATSATETQESVDSLSDRVDSLERSVEQATSDEQNTGRRLDVVEDDLEDLRQQISDLESSPSGGDGGGGN